MIRGRDILLVHFALNPDDELTRQDVAAKTGLVAATSAWELLRTMVLDDLLVTFQKSTGKNRPFFYRPGPALLRMIGRPQGDSRGQ